MKTRKALGLAALLLSHTTAQAHVVAQVYPGCSVPPAVSTGKTWWVDPVNGKTPVAWITYFAANPTDNGIQGDQFHPWNSLTGMIGSQWSIPPGTPIAGYTRPLLSSVVYYHRAPSGAFVERADTMGSPPIQPGDTIMLMGGDYGFVSIGGRGMVNSDWITVKPAPGQKPVFDVMRITGSNKWIFDGIKVQSVATVAPPGARAGSPLIQVTDGGATAPDTDIIFKNMDVSSADHSVTVGWTQAQWVSQGRYGFWNYGGAGPDGTHGHPNTSCISMTHSLIHNIRGAAQVAGNNSLFAYNEINYASDDGIDFAANNIAIVYNYIHNLFSAGDGNHPDAIQGTIGSIAAGVAYNQFFNILIDNNLVIRQTDPAMRFPIQLQGIDNFDSDWTNLVETNNVIITASCYGIFQSASHHSLIADNTVAWDGFPTSSCNPMVGGGGPSHQSLTSDNLRVVNNIVPSLSVDTRPVGVIMNHNLVTGSGLVTYYNQGRLTRTGGPNHLGADSFGDLVVPSGPEAEFQTWSPSQFTYDMRLLSGAAALRLGIAPTGNMPTTDYLGATRTSPYAVGAYAN